MTEIKRGEIYWVNLDPSVGSEIKKMRPAIIVSNDINNRYSPTVTIIPISSNVTKPYPFEVLIKQGTGGLKKDSLIKTNQIRTVDKARISGDAMDQMLDETMMQQVAEALKIHLSL